MNENKKILIVDDDDLYRDILKDNLSSLGVSIGEAKNGAEGFATAEKERPNLIILDVDMPGTTGIEMLKQLRKEEWGKDIHIVMLSNMKDNKTVSEAVVGGAFDYLVKNELNMKEITKLVKDRLAEGDKNI